MDSAAFKVTPGTQVVAIYDYDGTEAGSLSFIAGDQIRITDTSRDDMWYEGETEDGRTGLIPGNYIEPAQRKVEFKFSTWLHGKLSRPKVSVLLESGEEGLFLIRESIKFAGEYTLSLNGPNAVDGSGPEHYAIKRRQQKFTIDSEKYFEDLHELVEHYKRDADGLKTRLKNPIENTDERPPWYVSVRDFHNQGWIINKSDVTVQQRITQGEFSDVYRGKYLDIDTIFKSKSDKEALLAEAAVMTHLDNPNVEKLLGLVSEKPSYIVSECIWGGCLLDNLQACGPEQMSTAQLLKFVIDVCSGMRHLEEREIIHCDLAARNLMVNEEGTVKISNFHLARPMKVNYATNNERFPVKWSAPDALKARCFTSKSDVWSFGVAMWEIFSCGLVPYPNIKLSEVIKTVQKGYRLPCPDGCPAGIHKVMLTTWHKRSTRRPPFSVLLQRLEKIALESS